MNQPLLKEIQNILTQKDNLDQNVISLYDISILQKKITFSFNQILKNNKIINERCNNIITLIKNFNYDKEELNIIIIYDKPYNVICTKENNKLNSKILNTNNQFRLTNFHEKEISDIFDKFMKYKDHMTQSTKECKSTNSNFTVNINNKEISISSPQKEFNIIYSYLDNKYITITNDYNLYEITKNNEVQILKNIYINIQDCPEYMQKYLYEIRKEQIIDSITKRKKKH